MTERPLHLHGPGRAGTSLTRILAGSGVAVASVSGGHEQSRAAAIEVLGTGVQDAGSLPRIEAPGILIVSVPDDTIAPTLAKLARAPLAEGSMAFHLSGVHGLEVYPGDWPEGLGAAGFHPLRSFPSRDPGDRDLEGCLVAVEATHDTDRTELAELARRCGGEPVELAADGRAAWHLGAALMGNAVPALFDVALQAYRAAGVPEQLARDGLSNLCSRALDNARRLGVANALTGPVVRGDTGVLTRHLEAIARIMPEKRELYLSLVGAQSEAVEQVTDAEASERVKRWLEEAEA
jgi:predicted short-subunit dehydrogenase-like oxidoreductase (DUF2520 family)